MKQTLHHMPNPCFTLPLISAEITPHILHFYILNTGKICTITSAKPIPTDLSDPYTVIVLAYNPDQESLRKPDSEATVNVFVGAVLCFVEADPDQYAETYKVGEVSMGNPVVNISASSSCPGDIRFNITEQTLIPGKKFFLIL